MRRTACCVDSLSNDVDWTNRSTTNHAFSSVFSSIFSSAFLQPEDQEKWKAEFAKATNGRDEMSLLQFMHCTNCRSRYYSVKLFDALDVHKSGVISFGEYRRFKELLAYGTSEELSAFAFTLFDGDGDGVISRAELREGLVASIEENGEVMERAKVNKLVLVLMKLFGDNGSGTTREKFTSVLQSYPDILGNLTVGKGNQGLSARLRQRTKRTTRNGMRWMHDHPKRAITNFLTVLAIMACVYWRFLKYSGSCSGADLDFRDPFVNVTRREIRDRIRETHGIHMSSSDAKYMVFSKAMADNDPIECRDARKRILLSWGLPLAKGCGQGLKVVLTLILFPVSRTLMTTLRKTFLKNIFDFDSAIAYHRLLGNIGFVLAWVHSLFQVLATFRWADEDLVKQWSFAFPEDRDQSTFDLNAVTNQSLLISGVPADLLRDPSEQPTVDELTWTLVAITGYILLIIYSVAALFAFDYPKGLAFLQKYPGEEEWTMSIHRKVAVRIGRFLNNFNYFWYTHHLFALFYLVLLFHPMPDLPDERHESGISDVWVWVAVPALIYLIERVSRAFQSSEQTSVIGMRLLPGKVLRLTTIKPAGMRYKAGQYVFVNCYQIAPYEWHPFSLTSAPHEPYLSLHIRAAGDWTNALYKAVQDYKQCSFSAHMLETNADAVYPFNIKVAGPYGAPAQSYEEFRVVVCIGCGIGVTPFASVLSDVLHSIRDEKTMRLKKAYFHWVVRSRKEASWFKTLLDEISADDVDGVLDINIHITSLKHGNDLRLMLLRLAEFEDIDDEQSKVVGKSILHFGHPAWPRTLSLIQEKHSEESRIGVFYCGPSSLKNELKAECSKRNRVSSPKFVFRKERF